MEERIDYWNLGTCLLESLGKSKTPLTKWFVQNNNNNNNLDSKQSVVWRKQWRFCLTSRIVLEDLFHINLSWITRTPIARQVAIHMQQRLTARGSVGGRKGGPTNEKVSLANFQETRTWIMKQVFSWVHIWPIKSNQFRCHRQPHFQALATFFWVSRWNSAILFSSSGRKWRIRPCNE